MTFSLTESSLLVVVTYSVVSVLFSVDLGNREQAPKTTEDKVKTVNNLILFINKITPKL